MAKGRLSSSPFHVETARYKYAIEHETSDCYPSKTIIECDFYDKGTRKCRLWNSGFKVCESHRCRYYNKSTQRYATCDTCAYYYKEECCYPSKPYGRETTIDDASFCVLYLGNDDEAKFNAIRSICRRLDYTRIVDACERKIKSKDKIIAQSEKTLRGKPIDIEERKYLENKIKAKKAEREEVVKELLIYRPLLEKLGGRLDSFPVAEKSQKSKNNPTKGKKKQSGKKKK